MAITDWPADERPREKLLAHGAHTLSDAELLAIFLRVGVAGMSAVDLARALLLRFGNLNGIFAASCAELTGVNGMGNSKYAQLQAIFEMSRRALNEKMRTLDVLSSPDAVRDYLRLKLSALHREVFLVLLLDAQNRLMTSEELFVGTLSQTAVYPREVVKLVLQHNAAAVIFAHNHPSGVAEPSHADVLLTKTLREALALVDVKVLDHFVVAGNSVLSFVEQGIM